MFINLFHCQNNAEIVLETQLNIGICEYRRFTSGFNNELRLSIQSKCNKGEDTTTLSVFYSWENVLQNLWSNDSLF